MPVTYDLDGLPGAVLMDPLWQLQRVYVLGNLEASMEAATPTADGGTFIGFESDLAVQLWVRRKTTDLFTPVAEVIVPAGEKRAVAPALLVGYGMTLPVNLAAGSQVAVVHNGGLASWYAEDPKPTLTVTPHGTWA